MSVFCDLHLAFEMNKTKCNLNACNLNGILLPQLNTNILQTKTKIKARFNYHTPITDNLVLHANSLLSSTSCKNLVSEWLFIKN